MEAKDAIRRIKQFGLYHAIEDLPKSTLTVEAFNKAIRLLELEENGLLIELPCKVGDIIYDTFFGFVEECVVTSIEIYHDRICISFYSYITDGCATIDDFGNRVFVNIEEAELKLKEMNNT